MPEAPPEPGGGGGVPATDLQLVDSYQTIETLGGTTARDVQQAIYRELATGVTFPVRVPITKANAGNRAAISAALLAIAQVRAGNVIAAMAINGVLGMYAVQEFNAQNEQEDHWIVTVQSTSGSSTTELDVPFRYFVQALQSQVPAAVAALDQLEAVGLA